MRERDQPPVPDVDVDHRRVVVDDDGPVELHVAVAGPDDGNPVVLLHGFPDFWFGWRHQIPALAEAGYRVWVPDQRGYNTSDKPKSVGAYGLDTLTEDALAVAKAAGDGELPIVGHDWGAVVAWWAALEHPERVERMVAINVPHPAVFRRFLRRDPRQMARSWYSGFFQLPWLPERLLGARNGSLLAAMLTDSSRPEAFDDDEIAHYRRAWSHPGSTKAMVDWYRAFLRHAPEDPPDARVAPPTALFWGTEDLALREAMARPSVDLCDDGRLVRFRGASHWVHREVPDVVNRLLVDFLDGRELR